MVGQLKWHCPDLKKLIVRFKGIGVESHTNQPWIKLRERMDDVKIYRIHHIQYLLFMVQDDALQPLKTRPSWCLLRLFLCLNKHLLLHCSQHTDLMQIIDVDHVYNLRHYPLPFTTFLLRLFILIPSSTDIQIRRFNWVVQRRTIHK